MLLLPNKGIKVRCTLIILFLIIGSFFLLVPFGVHAEEKFVIVLDPGHGGQQEGAVREENGVEEKEKNLKIALYLREELEKYDGVSVVMTREDDETIDKLPERVQVAVDAGADLMVSLHNNARGPICEYEDGCNVLASEGLYRPELAKEEQELACNILYELKELGINDRGILLRESQSGDTYPNGQIADYYGLVRQGVKEEIPTIIIEHAFLDNTEDYERFLSDDDKLRELAKADARGLARYYGWKDKEGKTLPALTNIEEKVFVIVDEDYHHNRVAYQTFFEDKTSGDKEKMEEATTEYRKKTNKQSNGDNKNRNDKEKNVSKDREEWDLWKFIRSFLGKFFGFTRMKSDWRTLCL